MAAITQELIIKGFQLQGKLVNIFKQVGNAVPTGLGYIAGKTILDFDKGDFEIRVQQGSDIFRIFCFFDQRQLVVLMNGFQKKDQRTPKKEIEKALKIKKEYETDKK